MVPSDVGAVLFIVPKKVRGSQRMRVGSSCSHKNFKQDCLVLLVQYRRKNGWTVRTLMLALTILVPLTSNDGLGTAKSPY